MTVLPTNKANVSLAARALRAGKLVVIPTETVYGLACDATNREAVLAVFKAKGRPSDNPLIVHIADVSWVARVAGAVPETAEKLMAALWPGPLTLVLKKEPTVPDEVTAGLDTVAVRMPAHPTALAVIREAGVPIAAPSANRFMALSPTVAQNVDPELASHAEFVLDGGPCKIGLESTVVDCTGDVPRILRPGRILRHDIERVLNRFVAEGPAETKRSPGMYPRHYAPRTPMRLVGRLEPDQSGLVLSRSVHERQIAMPRQPEEYGARLYQALFELDKMALGQIYVESPPDEPAWAAVWDRLRKASA